MNDNVIIYYNNILRQKNITARLENAQNPNSNITIPNCYWCKTAFYTQLIDAKETQKYNYEKVKTYFKSRATKKYGMKNVLQEADIIFVPMNLGEMHWALGVIRLKDHRFEVVSSNKHLFTQHVYIPGTYSFDHLFSCFFLFFGLLFSLT